MGVQIGTSRRQPQRFGSLVFQDVPKRRAELAVTVHQHESLAEQKAVELVSPILRDLFHPTFVGIGRAPGEIFRVPLYIRIAGT